MRLLVLLLLRLQVHFECVAESIGVLAAMSSRGRVSDLDVVRIRSSASCALGKG